MRLALCLILLVVSIGSLAADPAQRDVDELAVSDYWEAYVQQIQAENKSDNVANKLADDIALAVATNDAELYLKNFALGLLAFQQSNFEKAIDYLVAAKGFVGNIPEKMQAKPLYYGFHFVLAKAYLAIENYELAYHHRRTYLIAYADDFEAKERALLQSLEHEYQIEQKEQANLLLVQQAELKQKQIKTLEREKQLNERNTYLIISVGFVFVLMILRQLRIRRKLTRLARTDMLTGLLNRTALFDEAEQLIKEACDNNEQLSLLVIDIDHFKKVNDNFGHQVGDLVLQKVASLGNEVMRSRDVFARFGGEEFVAVLPQASLDEASAIARHFKDKIANARFAEHDQVLEITLSIGVVSLAQVKPDVDALIKAADTAMYQGKRNGRDQVVIYSSEVEQNDNNVHIR